MLTLDVILSAAAQWLASGRRIHFSYSLRHDASAIVGLALLRVLVLPSVAVVAHRSWHAVSRYSAREDGYERLNDDNELGLRKAKADLRRDLWLGFLFVVASVWARRRQALRLRPGGRPAAAPRGLRHLRRPHDFTHKCGGVAPQQPRPVADPGAGRAATLAARARARTLANHEQLVRYLWDPHHDTDAVALPSVQLRRLPEVLGEARRDHGVATSRERGRSERARPGPRTRRRRGRGRGRGQGRGGRPGPAQAEVEITNWDIVREAAKLMRPSWWLVATALACVVASGVASLALPSYQGKIIDAVYARDRSRFRKMLELYLVFSVGTAATRRSVRSAFRSWGSAPRMCTPERAVCRHPASGDQLLRLDGKRHADITANAGCPTRRRISARRADDSWMATQVNQMTFPLTTLLGSLVAAIISLIGGVAMAFYTSWRLSMLAFTTVGPIVHVTQAYAQWSRDQNRRILAHLGEANAAATEALANVRTVKAMATEDREAKRYADHTMAARDRGIIDACLNALTSILTIRTAPDGYYGVEITGVDG